MEAILDHTHIPLLPSLYLKPQTLEINNRAFPFSPWYGIELPKGVPVSEFFPWLEAQEAC